MNRGQERVELVQIRSSLAGVFFDTTVGLSWSVADASADEPSIASERGSTLVSLPTA